MGWLMSIIMSQYKRIFRVFLANVFIIVAPVTIVVSIFRRPVLRSMKSTCFL